MGDLLCHAKYRIKRARKGVKEDWPWSPQAMDSLELAVDDPRFQRPDKANRHKVRALCATALIINSLFLPPLCTLGTMSAKANNRHQVRSVEDIL